MANAALIVAAGAGARAGDGLPKQYRDLGGEPVLRRTLRRFLAAPGVDRVLVCIDPGRRHLYDAAAAPLAGPKLLPPVAGGRERAETVRLGLEALAADPPQKVLIHDAARPFVSAGVIAAVLAALDRAPGACASIPIVDALRREEDGACGPLIPRENAWRAQTPQGFRFPAILAAHRAAHAAGADPTCPDDAEVARRAGLRVVLVESEADNFKITRPGDFARAERLIRAMEAPMDVRSGSGFDVHAFGPGDHLWLCGVKIPHSQGFVAHSDGDVGVHALCDALYGALAEGDIGAHFPPSDPQWRGAASGLFLRHAAGRVLARGGRIGSADVTLVCEHPKIGPHVAEMRAKLAAIMDADPGRVSVKATTSERLGFTGRGEGIAALATVTLLFGGAP